MHPATDNAYRVRYLERDGQEVTEGYATRKDAQVRCCALSSEDVVRVRIEVCHGAAEVRD